MIPADETFDGTFPFEPHFSDAPGFRMHYVDEGEGEPVILLHGEPTWGYLYPQLHSRVVGDESGDRARPHGLRQERDAAGSGLHAADARGESGGAD